LDLGGERHAVDLDWQVLGVLLELLAGNGADCCGEGHDWHSLGAKGKGRIYAAQSSWSAPTPSRSPAYNSFRMSMRWGARMGACWRQAKSSGRGPWLVQSSPQPTHKTPIFQPSSGSQ